MLTADHHFEDVLSFWFPTDISSDRATLTRQIEWWFRGGADGAIVERFTTLLEQAARGALDGWARMPRSRLALILVLDQFSRTVYRGTARAYAQDAKAIALALEGVANGHYLALETPWEKTFFSLPLGHSESLVHLDVVVRLAEDLVLDMPEDFRWWFDFSASQARANRDVIARFGRHPHRNELLGRTSTAEELEYLAAAQFVHTRPIPR